MKNIFDYKEFVNESKKPKQEIVNEGLFKWLKDQFKNLFNEADKKVKESKEINPKIETAKKNVDALFIKKIDELKSLSGGGITSGATSGETTGQQDLGAGQGESVIYNTFKSKLNEVDMTPTTTPPTTPTTTGTGGVLTDEAIKKSNDPNNPIEVSIKRERTTLEAALKTYLTSDNNLLKNLTNAKLSEYDSYVEGKRLEIYQNFTGPVAQKLATETQKKIETDNANIKKIMANLGNAAGLKAGDMFDYTTKDGYKNLILITKAVTDETTNKVTSLSAKTIFKFAVTAEDVKANDKLKERTDTPVTEAEFKAQDEFTPNTNNFDKTKPLNKDGVIAAHPVIDAVKYKEIGKMRKPILDQIKTKPPTA